jgi:hypothetical protein
MDIYGNRFFENGGIHVPDRERRFRFKVTVTLSAQNEVGRTGPSSSGGLVVRDRNSPADEVVVMELVRVEVEIHRRCVIRERHSSRIGIPAPPGVETARMRGDGQLPGMGRLESVPQLHLPHRAGVPRVEAITTRRQAFDLERSPDSGSNPLVRGMPRRMNANRA